jgi:tRNA-binding EMAP/Myf-like protein
MTYLDDVLLCTGLTVTASGPFDGPNFVLRKSATDAGHSHLLGTSPVHQVEVKQWMSFAVNPTVGESQIKALNNILIAKTYLVGNKATLADFCVMVAIANNASLKSLAAFPNTSRWFKHIYSLTANTTKIVQPTYASASGSVVFPLPVFDADVVAAPPAKEAAVPAAPAAASAAAAVPPTAPPAAGGGGDGLDPSRLDIRVGQVLKCWNHPESDKLLCEEVDLGNGEVRSIASGIRAFYNAEDLVGRKVMVLANLKERAMAGFKSQVFITNFFMHFCSMLCSLE